MQSSAAAPVKSRENEREIEKSGLQSCFVLFSNENIILS